MRKILFFVAFLTMALWGNAQSWTQQTSGVNSLLSDVCFVNDSTGWISTTGAVLKTTNGGNNWSSNTTGINVATDLKSIFFVSENIGWAVGTGGVILNTTNGGQSWANQSTGTTKDINSVFFVNDSVGWAIVSAGTNPSTDPATILNTRNGGNTWTLQTTIPSFYQTQLNTLYFLDENLGWAVGGGCMFRLTNSGDSLFGECFGINTNFRDVYFTSASNGWVVGDNGKIYVSTDSGTTWTQQVSGMTRNLLGIHFTSQTEGWVVGAGTVGAGPVLLHTTNGGANWTTITLTTTSFGLIDVLFLPSGKGWAVGSQGRIYTYNSTPSSVEPILPKYISVYPNPTEGLINLKMTEVDNCQLNVYDMLGKNMYSLSTNETQVQIDMTSWPAGHYKLIILNEKGQLTTETIVKQ
jgi:photosystem II stability/assembly factor-like uncharacterized protein